MNESNCVSARRRGLDNPCGGTEKICRDGSIEDMLRKLASTATRLRDAIWRLEELLGPILMPNVVAACADKTLEPPKPLMSPLAASLEADEADLASDAAKIEAIIRRIGIE